MEGFIPGIPGDSTNEMIGLIGAVIMPHNLFLHSALGIKYFSNSRLP
jgi:natural resistance-associated macrophage protein 2